MNACTLDLLHTLDEYSENTSVPRLIRVHQFKVQMLLFK